MCELELIRKGKEMSTFHLIKSFIKNFRLHNCPVIKLLMKDDLLENKEQQNKILK